MLNRKIKKRTNYINYFEINEALKPSNSAYMYLMTNYKKQKYGKLIFIISKVIKQSGSGIYNIHCINVYYTSMEQVNWII